MSAFLELHLSKDEVDFESQALTRGVSLAAASARDYTLIQTSGAASHERVFLTETPQVVKLPLPCAKFNGDAYEISNRALLIFSQTRTTASINAVLASSVSGQGFQRLQRIVGNDDEPKLDGSLPLQYPNWPAFSAVLGVRNARVVDDKGRPHKVVFTSDAEMDTRMNRMDKILTSLYNTSWDTRGYLVSPFAPNLSKSVMAVPVGHAHQRYSLCIEAVNKHSSLDPMSMEALIKAAMSMEFGEEIDSLVSFLDKHRKGMEAAKFAENCVTALSTVAASLVPYRADGRTTILPDGQKTFSAESWSAEATSAPIAADDCDGSAALITSFFNAARDLFSVSETQLSANIEKYPYLYGLVRSLSHFEPAIGVLGAYAAHADAAVTGTPKLAGHAMVLFLPKLHVAQGLSRGIKSSVSIYDKKNKNKFLHNKRIAHPSDDTEFLSQAYLEALYPKENSFMIPQEELDLIHSELPIFQYELQHGRFKSLTSLAAEGTSAAMSRLYTRDSQQRNVRSEESTQIFKVSQLLSPSIASVVKPLDTGENGEHRFYSQFVEVIFGTTSPSLHSPDLVALCKAHAQHVLCAASQVSTDSPCYHISQAGITPRQLVECDFVSVPLYTVPEEDHSVLLESIAEVRQNTLMRSSNPMKLGQEETEYINKARELFHGLNDKLSTQKPSSPAYVDLVIPFAALVHNPGLVSGFVDMVQTALPQGSGGRVTWNEVPNLAVNAKGDQVGALVSICLHVNMEGI